MTISEVIDQIKAWPLKKKIALALLIALSIAVMTGIMLWSQRVDYQVLYSNLSQEDAGQVITKLREMKVPYKVEGNVIYVPSARVYELRLDLAAQGIPQGGGVGFEIFDKTQIGVTEFVQRLNYIRALQGELTRTIRQLSEVEQSRVHIAIPERTLFSEKEERPTASVVLKLKPGRVLSQGQIGGIVHLVASSVEGMSPQNVTVIDNMGNLLSKPMDGDMIADARQLSYQKAVDKEYEGRLQSMLEGIVGKGKAIVRVATKIDFSQVEKTEEKFDPDSAVVKTEQRNQEKSTGAVNGGIPGVLSNQPGQQPASSSGAPSSSQKQSENINYEVSRSVSKISLPRGEIKSISVAVLVDGTYRKEKNKTVYQPRSEEEIKKYEEIVKASVGFSRERGDQVIVQNMPFEAAAEELPAGKPDYLKIVITLLKYLVPIAVIAVLILFVVKPLLEMLKAPAGTPQLPAGEAVPAVPALTEPETTQQEIMRERIVEVVKKDPRKAAMIVKEWLSE